MKHKFNNLDGIKDFLVQYGITDLSNYNNFYYNSLNKFIKCPLCNGKQSITVDHIKHVLKNNLLSFDFNFK